MEKRIITQKYLDFCRSLQKRQLKEVKGLTHKHHIYPKSLYPGLKNSKYNIVILTICEHIEAHRMLAESKNACMIRAFNFMSSHKLSLKGTWHTEETKNKIRKALVGKYVGENNPNFGNKWNEEKRNIQSKKLSGENNPNYGKKRLEHSIKMKGENNPNYGKIGKDSPNYGKKHSEETKTKIAISKLKKVICIETGEVFNSVSKALKKYNCHIGSCCTGKIKTAGGYHWKYYTE
jgi:hypothetical protein